MAQQNNASAPLEAVRIELPENVPSSASPPPLTTKHWNASQAGDVCLRWWCTMAVFFSILFFPYFCYMIFGMSSDYPTFKVRSVSVTPYNIVSDNTSSFMTAKWDIGFSVRNPNMVRRIIYNNISISFNRTTIGYSSGQAIEYSSGTIVPIAAHQGPKRTKLFNATIDATSPPQLVYRTIDGGLYLEFGVTIQVNVTFVSGIFRTGEYVISGVCTNMKVGISSNATQGTWVGRPKSCFSSAS